MFRRKNPLLSPLVLASVLLLAVLLGAAWMSGMTGGLLSGLPIGSISPGTTVSAATPTASATATAVPLNWAEKADVAAQAYFDAWKRQDYAAMYSMLSETARASISQERFIGRYQAIMGGVGITDLSVLLQERQFLPNRDDPSSAEMKYELTFSSLRFDPFREQGNLPLVREQNEWKVRWTPDLIFRELGASNLVSVEPDDPQRGKILDRNGVVLAGPGRALELGLVPGEIKDVPAVTKALATILSIDEASIKSSIDRSEPDWWVPFRQYNVSREQELKGKITGLAGVYLRDITMRVYPFAATAAHVTGYVTLANDQDAQTFAEQGIEESDFFGRAGVEYSMNRELSGIKGGAARIVDPSGRSIRVLAERKVVNGADVHLSIDIKLQEKAVQALGKESGSVIVMDPNDNSILAAASTPSFDPNLFVLGISETDWDKLANDPRSPFINRTADTAYATGSIFKVITMAAGLERGGFKPTDSFTCTGSWQGLPGLKMGDWVPQGHGNLDLHDGLVQSCDIVFYEVSKKLYEIDPDLLSQYAREFGLGEKSGVVGMWEVTGTVPDTAWKRSTLQQDWFGGDVINLGIGQGYLEATSLQMANLYAAIANGGSLRTPVLVTKVVQGTSSTEIKFQERRKLPVSAANLKAIQSAMVDVANTPEGTAYYAFRGYEVETAAKTGSAENQGPKAHAWFAGYAPADKPEAVVLVMVEGGEMGGEVAAPIGRKVFEDFFGKP